MKDKTKMVMLLAVGEMTLVALGSLAWKHPQLALLTAFDGSREWRRLFGQVAVIAFCPIWLAAGWLVAQRRLATMIPRPTQDYRRWIEASLIASGLALLVMQAWVARNFIAEENLGREALLRAITLFLGAVTTAQGNFLAKVEPPVGEGAPAPGVWTRVALRMGWAMAVTGLGIMIGALVLDMPALFFVPLTAFLALIANAVLSRRALRPQG
ncbi:hypothetical protein [Caulobacter segnis]|jgi:hypothetical protein|uniref:hypothetical protein n=1 Tax=Caulobacter segnis TaxID=88688 RepID=UPI001CBF5E5C|nr:hypothetical protein [Caulobacter segnis]UAL09645.1 hypothetical protein K8940_17970 [Caulobacter segnis]